MKKLAVIDVGSNTTRMVVVNLYDNGSYRIVDELKAVSYTHLTLPTT